MSLEGQQTFCVSRRGMTVIGMTSRAYMHRGYRMPTVARGRPRTVQEPSLLIRLALIEALFNTWTDARCASFVDSQFQNLARLVCKYTRSNA